MAHIEWLSDFFLTTSLVMPRLLAFAMVLPILAPPLVPGLARNALCFSIGVFLFPMVNAALPSTPSFWSIGAIAIKEAFLGALIGFLGSLVFWTAQSLGDLIEFQSGASMSMSFDPSQSDQSTPLGAFFMRFAMVVFIEMGGLLLLLGFVLRSFELWPVRSFFPVLRPGFLEFFANLASNFLSAVCLAAAPILLIMFVIVIVMGIMNRFVHMLDVYSFSLPFQRLAVSLMVVVSLSSMLLFFRRHFYAVLERLQSLERLFK